MDELTKICNELEKCDHTLCQNDKIICVKKKLKEYIGEDENKYLELKAQIKLHNEYKRTGIINSFSLPVSLFSVCLTIIYNISGKEKSIAYIIYALYGLLAICIIMLLDYFFNRKNKYKKIWINYIEIVLENWELKEK